MDRDEFIVGRGDRFFNGSFNSLFGDHISLACHRSQVELGQRVKFVAAASDLADNVESLNIVAG